MIDPLIIEVIRQDAELKMGVYNRSERNLPLSSYNVREISVAEITKLSNEIVELLNQANRPGILEDDLLIELKKTGGFLYAALLTDEVKDRLYQDQSSHLILFIDETLIQIPWELLFDGDNFLCLKYALGRMVRTIQKPRTFNRSLTQTSRQRMLILADTTGDLKQAYKEGRRIRDEMGTKLRVNLLIDIDLHSVKKEIHEYDIVHFAGHADYDGSNPSASGWLFKKERLSARNIIQLGSSNPLPTLIFSNACESAKTGEWKIGPKFEDKIYGLANAFLLAGAKYYIGTFWKVADEASSVFALEFYKRLASGISIGEAVKLSREALRKRFGARSVVWTSYLLYGDPSSTFFGNPAEAVIKTEGFWISRSTQYITAVALFLMAILFAILFWGKGF